LYGKILAEEHQSVQKVVWLDASGK